MVDVLDYRTMPFSTVLSENVDIVQTIYNHSTDIKTRTFPLAGSREAFMLFIDGMVNESLLDLHVLAPLLQARTDKSQIDFAYIGSIVTTSQLTIVTSFEDLLNHIANGCVALLVDQLPFGIAIGVAGWQQRALRSQQQNRLFAGQGKVLQRHSV